MSLPQIDGAPAETEFIANGIAVPVKLRMNQAIGRAMRDELAADPGVVVYGEDLAKPGGVFKTSEGLLDEFGPLRVRDTPISEMAMIGAGVGAAAAGLRPVVEIMFADFYAVAIEQVCLEAAKLHYLTGGQYSIPLVVRGSSGAGRGFAATHSGTVETWFFNTPGLTVVVPSSPAKAYGLLRSAIQYNGPVIVLEPRVLYGQREEFVPDDSALVQLGTASVDRSGADVTIVALGQMVKAALAAAEQLDGQVSCEVIDLQTLLPWDRNTVLESARRTGRLVIVEENPKTGGWGGEIASTAASELFGQLKAPVHRITCPDAPVPFSKELEMRYIPSPDYIAEQVRELVETATAPRAWWEES